MYICPISLLFTYQTPDALEFITEVFRSPLQAQWVVLCQCSKTGCDPSRGGNEELLTLVSAFQDRKNGGWDVKMRTATRVMYFAIFTLQNTRLFGARWYISRHSLGPTTATLPRHKRALSLVFSSGPTAPLDSRIRLSPPPPSRPAGEVFELRARRGACRLVVPFHWNNVYLRSDGSM
jgi:hypothetical protein